MTIDQIFALMNTALGIVPNPALATSIEGYKNAINANPLAHTLLGQEVIQFTFIETLNLLTESLRRGDGG
jgi:hypothetical protein